MIPYLLLMNALGFVLMHWDKHLAKKRHWRIPEAVLFLVAFLGGSIGTVIGMNVFHHKTLKLRFVIGIPLILAIQSLLALWVFYSIG